MAKEDRAGWSQPLAPDTTALNQTCGGEAYCSQTGTGERVERAEQDRSRGKDTRNIRKHSKTAGKTQKAFHFKTLPHLPYITIVSVALAFGFIPPSCQICILILCSCCNDPVSHSNIKVSH